MSIRVPYPMPVQFALLTKALIASTVVDSTGRIGPPESWKHPPPLPPPGPFWCLRMSALPDCVPETRALEALTLARHAVSSDPVAQATAYSFIALGT